MQQTPNSVRLLGRLGSGRNGDGSSLAAAHDFYDDHSSLRKAALDFAEREVVPNLATWEAQQSVDPQLSRKAGDMGLLGIDVPERFGGGGIDDFRFSAVVAEELCYAGSYGAAMNFIDFNDVVAQYFRAFGTPEHDLAADLFV